MSNWFDRFAMRAARSTAHDAPNPSAVPDAGLSRRQVLARGAVITGVAWTAPALLAARPAFAGASICTDSNKPDYSICPDANGTELCCPLGEECVYFPERDRYDCDVPLGSPCTNNGNGQCNGGISRCNHTASTERERICGGPGTECLDGSSCVFNNCGDIEGNGRRCGGLNATCVDSTQCAPADPNDDNAYICVAGLCQPT